MKNRTATWKSGALTTVAFGCVLFVILTVAAMFIYPGSTYADRSTTGYSFFHNFFSDLGMTITYNGELNTGSMVLFTVALAGGGLVLILFYLITPSLFWRTIGEKVLSSTSMLFGIVAGISFIGIAFTPANLKEEIHYTFVLVAFLALPFAVIPHTMAILINRNYPNAYAIAYAVFAVILGGYVWLLFFGPTEGEQALVIHVTGQKIVAYAAVISVYVQAQASKRVARRPLIDRPTFQSESVSP